MERNKLMTDITAMLKMIDYKKYFSYGDVQQALARGEISLPPREVPKCKYCGTPIPAFRGESPYCSKICRKLQYDAEYTKTRVRLAKQARPFTQPPITGKPPQKLWEHIEAILPLWNKGMSDYSISLELGIYKKYICRIRHYFHVPANFGRPPVVPLTMEDLEANVPRDKRLTNSK
jgi:hypothetical protein